MLPDRGMLEWERDELLVWRSARSLADESQLSTGPLADLKPAAVAGIQHIITPAASSAMLSQEDDMLVLYYTGRVRLGQTYAAAHIGIARRLLLWPAV